MLSTCRTMLINAAQEYGSVTTNPAASSGGVKYGNGFVEHVKGDQAATMDHRNIAAIENLEAKVIRKEKTMVSKLNGRLQSVKTTTDEDNSNTNSKSSF